ncbi:Acetylcholinesterase 1 [Folsomia candida]|uniref:Acetylcholinesterase 1 n=1 Tax=Folsomia candida TaxID=158441 RepID=A0A226EDC1_FOLCA|nr:Acetylcholinesterase 1 [Folsomia candida]
MGLVPPAWTGTRVYPKSRGAGYLDQLRICLPYPSDFKYSEVGIHETIERLYFKGNRLSRKFADKKPGLIALYGAVYFKTPLHPRALIHSQLNNNTFLYLFKYNGVQNVYVHLGGLPDYIEKGVAHGDEIPYLFYREEFTKDEERSVSSTFVNMWYDFAKNGDPNPIEDAKLWPKFTKDDETYMDIDVINSPRNDWVSSWTDDLSCAVPA